MRRRRKAVTRRKPVRRRKSVRRRKPVRRRRNKLTKSQLAKYRRAVKRYGRGRGRGRGLMANLRARHRRANPGTGFIDVGKFALKGGIGFLGAVGAGGLASQMVASRLASPVGSFAMAGLFEAFNQYDPVRSHYWRPMAIGAAVAGVVSSIMTAVESGLIPQSIAQYIPGAPVPVVVNGNGAVAGYPGMGAVVEQAGLYGSPLETSMQHRLNMIEQGMSGGIFDHKTTLGEYDVLESAPAGTMVQGALADYEVYPPSMGAAVEQATAGFRGMGATVQEAFAGPGLREYVSVPLSDYVATGGPRQYWGQSPQGLAILSQIKNAARSITAQRAAAGLPVGPAFKQQLASAAMQAVHGQEKDVSMAAPASPLTVQAAPFPGAVVPDVSGVVGQPAAIAQAQELLGEEDSGIFG